MAQRPVYMAIERVPYVMPIMVDFEWNGGFAKVQKQKNIRGLHEGFKDSAGCKCRRCSGT